MVEVLGEKMKDYFVDLEIAKKLKENGFPQEGNSGYFELTDGCSKCSLIFSTPNVDEILKELPQYIEIETSEPIKELILSISRTDEFMVNYGSLFIEYDKILCNALAKLWLLLKEHGYIK